MIKAMFLTSVLAIYASGAAAMGPVTSSAAFKRGQFIEEVKIVCERGGYCYRPRGRHPVPRWIYGDDAFNGPGRYTGPGNYGWPGSHSIWWPFGF